MITPETMWGFSSEPGFMSATSLVDHNLGHPSSCSVMINDFLSPYGFQVPSSRQPAKSRFLDDILRQGLSPDRSVSRSSNGFSKGSSRLNAWDSSSTPSRLSKKSTQTLDDFQMPYSKEDSCKKMVEEKRSQNAKDAHIKQKHFLSQKQRQSNKDRFNLALSKTANSEHHSRHDIESISSLPALQTDAPSPSYLNRRNTNGPTIFGSPLYKQAFESSSPHCEDIDVEPSGFNHMKGKPPSKIKKRMRTISTTHKVVSHSAAKPHRHSLPANFDLAYIFVPLEDDFIKEPHGDLVKITKSNSAKVDIDDYNEELEIKHVKEDEVKEVKESESEGDDIKEDIWVEGSSEEDDDDDGDDEEDVIEKEQEENK